MHASAFLKKEQKDFLPLLPFSSSCPCPWRQRDLFLCALVASYQRNEKVRGKAFFNQCFAGMSHVGQKPEMKDRTDVQTHSHFRSVFWEWDTALIFHLETTMMMSLLLRCPPFPVLFLLKVICNTASSILIHFSDQIHGWREKKKEKEDVYILLLLLLSLVCQLHTGSVCVALLFSMCVWNGMRWERWMSWGFHLPSRVTRLYYVRL